ncbi:MAG: FAD-binding and (Fe-S)-binding domain-containing protein [Muribaculaceae bacterium]|nr:FAD-binding and (Fe-S)-binding domain-containing protein [Muribaculaceae bacterium]
MKPNTTEFLRNIKQYVSKDRIYTDDLRCLAWGTDAGFYRLVPQVVVRSRNVREVQQVLRAATAHRVPVTFRAAGTSLSGQAISDSVLLVAGKNWENYEFNDDASVITLEPGIVGARVNELLKPYGRFFEPDPASKNSAMVGGIVINNASGMNCGTHANSDRILRSVRIVLADGTLLNTGDARSREAFAESHPEVLTEIEAIREEIHNDRELYNLIEKKYRIKNVTGLNLRPFIAYENPFDIIAHCMVGSEGTLGFLASITCRTAPIKPFVASSMVYFREMYEASRAVVALKKSGLVDSCEMLDKKSLSSCNDITGDSLTALLMDTKADTQEELDAQIRGIKEVLSAFDTFKKDILFTSDPAVYGPWWAIRSGIFPAVGGTRAPGTTVLIEDVAFHIDDLPNATCELAQLLEDCGYDDACIYGHALEGNYHFVIAQSFETEADIERYKHLMLEIERLVVDKYHGSLKAEHGTGRNMAPFVEKEWGSKAFAMMRRLKDAMDPQGILNPGVIFNDDPECYIRNIKHLPLTDPHVDKCIECGFCEVNCVSCGFTLSARQRIASQREISYLRSSGRNPKLLKSLEKGFKYYGNETCAGDGLCSTSCPMKINTADLIHDLREKALPKGSMGYKTGAWAAKHLSGIESTLRPVLSMANGVRAVIGNKAVDAIGRGLNHCGVPLWSSALPGAADVKVNQPSLPRKVVYFPSCINQTMGPTAEKGEKVESLVKVMTRLCNKAGYEVIFPRNMKGLCCGMIWESKGMPDIADAKTAELEKALLEASEDGRIPVLCDQSPCLHRMRDHIHSMKLYEPAEFISTFLVPYLNFKPTAETVAVHVTCSTRRMGLASTIIGLASRCSKNVVVPSEVGCCGFAGDKGFMVPELNRWALRKLKPQLQVAGVARGFSNSRTCEIGLTTNSGVNYKSIAYLVDEVTTPRPAGPAE